MGYLAGKGKIFGKWGWQFITKMGVDKFADFKIIKIGKFKNLKFRVERRGAV